MAFSNPDVTVTKTLAPAAKKNQLRSYGDSEAYEHGRVSKDTYHKHDGHSSSHPVIVTTDSDEHFVDQHGDSYVVGDSGFGGIGGELLDDVSHWFGGHPIFLDSKNDLDAAREANKYLQ